MSAGVRAGESEGEAAPAVPYVSLCSRVFLVVVDVACVLMSCVFRDQEDDDDSGRRSRGRVLRHWDHACTHALTRTHISSLACQHLSLSLGSLALCRCADADSRALVTLSHKCFLQSRLDICSSRLSPLSSGEPLTHSLLRRLSSNHPLSLNHLQRHSGSESNNHVNGAGAEEAAGGESDTREE